jgi:prepilin-type N-terminal cleavage/methylation domain-containing protein
MKQAPPRKAFTVIELLIVIAIIGILVTIAVPAVKGVLRSSRRAESVNNLRAWGRAIQLHATRNNWQLPSLVDETDPLYAASPSLRQFFDEYDLAPEIAYSPSSGHLRPNFGLWATHEIDIAELVWENPVDNSSVGTGGGTSTVTWQRDNEDSGFAPGSGTWETSTSSGVIGANARYSNDADSTAAWTFAVPPGSGTLKVEAYIRRGPKGHDNIVYDIEGTDSGAQTSSAISLRSGSIEYAWVNLGNYTFAGGTRTITVRGVGAGSENPLPPEVVIVDDKDGGGSVTITGTWTETTYRTPYHADGYRHDQNAGKGSKSVRFTPNIPIAGEYEVFMWYPSAPVWADNVPVDVTHKNGTNTVTVDQNQNAGTWRSLGTFEFDTGTGGSVLVRTTGTTSHVAADAVKFVEKNPATSGGSQTWADAIRISGDYTLLGGEPNSPGYYVLQGEWLVSTYRPVPERYGSSYQVADRDGTTRKAAWLFTVPERDEYDVYAYFPAASSFAPDAEFTVYAEDRTFTTQVAQTDSSKNDYTNEDNWRKLGRGTFSPGTLGRVEILSQGNDGKKVIADAVRVARTIITGSESMDVIGYLYLGRRTGVPDDSTLLDSSVKFPSSLRAVVNLSETPLVVDMFAPDSASTSPWATTYEAGIHTLYMDGHVDWVSDSDTKPRWRDAFGNKFRW